MMHFVRTFSTMRARGVRLIRKGLKLWKNCIHQKHVRKWLMQGMHPPHPPLVTNCDEAFISQKQFNGNVII